MKGWQRRFTPEARTLLQRLPPEAKSALRALTDKLLLNSYLGKALQKELSGHYSIRHSHYRVIYSLQKEKKFIVIEYLGLRHQVYDLFALLLKQQKRR